MKQIIPCGSTTDGWEYFMEVGETTTGGKHYRRRIGGFVLEPVSSLGRCAIDMGQSRLNFPEPHIAGSNQTNLRKEYYPFLEPL
jgi:hypothetical protein